MNTSTEKAETMQELIIAFEVAMNGHDAEALAETFAEDADFTNVFGQAFHGRKAIELQHEPVFTTMFKSIHFTVTKTAARILSDTLTAADVHWSMTGATDPIGNPWPERKGLMNLIIKNEKGKSLILLMHNMDLPVISVGKK